MSKTWRAHPLHTVAMEILKRKGALTDAELFELLKEEFEDLGFSELNKLLMRLEIEGKIYVSSLTRGKRRIEFIKEKT